MPSKMRKYVIEGDVKGVDDVRYGQARLAVSAYVNGVKVAQAPIDKSSHYKLTFESAEFPTTTELCILPVEQARKGNGHRPFAINKTISPQRFVIDDGARAHAHTDLFIPRDYTALLAQLTKTYRMHGAVYATTFAGTPPVPVSIEPLPAVRLEFFETDTPLFWPIGTTPTLSEDYLGYTYAGPDGSYQFAFNFSSSNIMTPWMWLYADKTPDIRVRVSQFFDGVWNMIYEGPVDWDISDDYHRDYFIPVELIQPVPDAGVKPDEGFRFTSLGLLPIDATRLVDGYAYAQPGDPAAIAGVSHQPFCGVMRIFGLFAETPPVATYKVQYAVANSSGPTGVWQDVVDALYNRKWNPALHVWESVVLGPDPVTGRYQNIDTQPEADWHEHALKITWNSANQPNGYYALRVIGYDAAGLEIGAYMMPVMRVDNSQPQVRLEVIGASTGAVTPCGALKLGFDRRIQFRITAYDAEGHVLAYSLSGTRGKDAVSAGAVVSDDRASHAPGTLWTGTSPTGDEVDFTAAALPVALSGCSMLAYNMQLHVLGLATDGYTANPLSQQVWLESNLIVSEP